VRRRTAHNERRGFPFVMRHVEHPLIRHGVVRDYPTLLAYLLVGAASVILFNLIADILYAVIDPRIRYS
jgi:hypothetical protein